MRARLRRAESTGRGPAGQLPDQMIYLFPRQPAGSALLVDYQVLVNHAQPDKSCCLQSRRSAELRFPRECRTLSATPHAGQRSGPALASWPRDPGVPATLGQRECNTPRSRPPSGPKTTNAAAHKTEAVLVHGLLAQSEGPQPPFPLLPPDEFASPAARLLELQTEPAGATLSGTPCAHATPPE